MKNGLLACLLLALSNNVYADKVGYDINNYDEMRSLGAVYGCSLYYTQIDNTMRAALLGAVVDEEFETDWNKMRNKTITSVSTDILYKAINGDKKTIQACDTIYGIVLSMIK